jgi:C-terminal processing protease CtpA/Prc
MCSRRSRLWVDVPWIADDFAAADALVIDIRFNQGGSDSMGYALAGWLSRAKRELRATPGR